MAKHKGQDQTEELERYLSHNFNLEIYEDLTEGDNVGLFEPLEFFKLLYAQYEFVEATKEKPLTVVKRLRELKLTHERRYFLLYYLISRLKRMEEVMESARGAVLRAGIIPSGGDAHKRLSICRHLIEKEFAKLERELFPQNEDERESEQEKRFDWASAKQHLETLPDDTARLKCLYEVKAEYEQTFSRHLDLSWGEPTFAEKCAIEIRKLKDRLALERKPKAELRGQTKDRKEKRDKGGTQYQNHLALHYLLLYAKANCHNTKKAEFASFLTGYSEERFRQQWSNIHRKADESGQIWERDMRLVRGHFEALGLHEITKLIDNDLDSERGKL